MELTQVELLSATPGAGWRRWGRRLLLVGLVLTISSFALVALVPFIPTKLSRIPESADPHQRLLRDFDILVFNRYEKPFWWSSTSMAFLQKWNSQVSFSIEGAKRTDIRAQVIDRLDTLRGLTGLSFQEVADVSKGNLKIFYLRKEEVSPETEFEAKLMTGACNSIISIRVSEIVAASIFVDADAGRVRASRCIKNMLVQVLGFSVGSPEVQPSIFNTESQASDLTPKDRALIKLLYDNRLTPRMKRQDALGLARLIIMQNYTADEAAQLSAR